jgi:hypothetical protein
MWRERKGGHKVRLCGTHGPERGTCISTQTEWICGRIRDRSLRQRIDYRHFILLQSIRVVISGLSDPSSCTPLSNITSD